MSLAHPLPRQPATSRSEGATCTGIRSLQSLLRSAPGNQVARAAAPAASGWRRQRTLAHALQNGSTHPSKEPIPHLSPTPGPILLWYKRDLRLDDHPGWHAAAGQAAEGKSATVVPVFCFDPARYAHLVLPPGGAEALHRALASLYRSLRQRGSRLLVRVGPWEEQLPQLAAELGAAGVIAEREVEAEWNQGVGRVAAALPPGVAVQQWQAPLLASHTDDYRELKARQPGINPPLPTLEELPPLPAGAADPAGDNNAASTSDAALGISSSQLRQLVAEAYISSLSPLLQPLVAGLQGYNSSSGREAGATGSSGSSFSEDESASPGGTNGPLIDRLVSSGANSGSGITDGATKPGPRSSSSGSSSRRSWEAEVSAEIAAGEGPVLKALGSYLRRLETAADGGSSQREAAALAEAIAAYDLPATPDGCFPALFGRALSLGVVSKRRVYAEAAAILQQQVEQPRPGGFNLLQQLGWLLTSGGGAASRLARQKKAAAAAAAVEAGDFHEQTSAKREGRAAHGATLHHWRWRGLLTDYLAAPAAAAGNNGSAAAAATDPSNRPAILLCHGFGAFSEHFRDNVAALAAAGYDVYAPTLPGYGRAEKPVLPYGQDLWTSFLAGFVLQVVRRPVVVAGNSIGGFISASLAADYPGLVQGLVLLNSAGRIVPNYQPPTEPPTARPPPPVVVSGVSRALFAFLEGNAARQLRQVYPVRPERADEWLGGEIARAARDPGALGVFRSVFYLPPPRALNYLVSQLFGGPTLVLQGVKDPLNNAPARADELERHCPNAQVVKLDAGHCPHDEIPEVVNAELLKFIEQRVLPASSNTPKATPQASQQAAIAAK